MDLEDTPFSQSAGENHQAQDVQGHPPVQGHEVIVPSFGTRNWISIARQAKRMALDHKPDVVHIFNVPDVIYHGFAGLRGRGYKK